MTGPPAAPSPPTMGDVARLAGVSAMTVSRTLAGRPVAAATRQRVLAAVEQLHYMPDDRASALSSGRSPFVAAMLPTLNHSNFTAAARGLTDALADAGLTLLLGYTDYSAEREEALVRAMLRHRPKAVLLTGGFHTPGTAEALRRAALPVVETWDDPAEPLDRVVGFSNAKAMAMMVRHLAGRGYRRIAFLGGEDRTDRRGLAREQGFADSIEALGLGPPRIVRHGRSPHAMEHGARAVVRLMQTWPDTQAACCVSDMSAFGAIMECRRQGWDVPGRLAIAGFGDFEVSRWCDPRITTLAMDAYGLGHCAGRLVLDTLAGRPAPARIMVPIRVEPRESA